MRKLTTVSFCPFPFLFLVVLAAGTTQVIVSGFFLPNARLVGLDSVLLTYLRARFSVCRSCNHSRVWVSSLRHFIVSLCI